MLHHYLLTYYYYYYNQIALRSHYHTGVRRIGRLVDIALSSLQYQVQRLLASITSSIATCESK